MREVGMYMTIFLLQKIPKNAENVFLRLTKVGNMQAKGSFLGKKLAYSK